MELLSQLVVSLLDVFNICILRQTQYGVVVFQQPVGQAEVLDRVEDAKITNIKIL